MASARQSVRSVLASFLPNFVTLQAVYEQRIYNFGGQSPVALLDNGGTRFERETHQGFEKYLGLDIHLFVLMEQTEDGYDEEEADEVVDALLEGVARLVNDVQRSSAWRHLHFRDAIGPPENLVVGGGTYRHIIVPVEAWV